MGVGWLFGGLGVGLENAAKQQKKLERDRASLHAAALAKREEAERRRKEGVQADSAVAEASREARLARITAMKLAGDGIRRGSGLPDMPEREGLTIAGGSDE